MRLLFFAHLRDITGQSEIEWSVAEPLSAEALWRRLVQTYPRLAPYQAVVRLARNGEYVTAEARFEAGDEVALIPPVSGG